MPQTLEPLLRGYKFFAGLADDHLALLAACASNAVFPAGTFLYREGEPAETFYLIREGKVALEVTAPGRGALVVETVSAGEVTGFSWLIEPHRWEFDGLAVEQVRAVQMNGACLRAKCDTDPLFGYELMRRFAALVTDRLQATRLQLLDIYGHAHDS